MTPISTPSMHVHADVAERQDLTNAITVIATPRLSAKALEDYTWVCAAVAGNRKGYEILLNRYRNSVYTAMFRMVKNKDEADDLTIEAFGKAFNKLGSYAPDYAFSTWLFRIAINNCIDHIRKKRIQTFSIDETIKLDGDKEFSHNIRDHEPDPEQRLIHQQKLAYVSNLVNKLSGKYRDIIELRFYKDCSYEEIAQELNLPLGTVKAQLFRAKDILLHQMTDNKAKPFLDYRPEKLEA